VGGDGNGSKGERQTISNASNIFFLWEIPLRFFKLLLVE